MAKRKKPTSHEYINRYRSLVLQWQMRVFNRTGKTGTLITIREQYCLDKIYTGFMEIGEAINGLRMAVLFVTRTPPRIRNMSKDEYLRYHIHAYLQEWYILQLRLRDYCKAGIKIYKKDANADNIKSTLETLADTTRCVFENWVTKRGGHVHQLRFDDTQLRHLSMISAAAETMPSIWGTQEKLAYSANRKKWLRQMAAKTLEVDSHVNEYFKIFCNTIAPLGNLDPQ